MANQAYTHYRPNATWVLPPGPDAKHTVVRYRSDGTFTIAVNDLDIVAEFDFGDAVGFQSWLTAQINTERDARFEERLRNTVTRTDSDPRVKSS